MSSDSPNTTGKRRDTLELKGGQVMATDEQIRQHCPELFEAGFYTERVQEELRESAITFPLSNLKSRLSEEDQDRFDTYTADLSDRILKQLSEIPFEYNIDHESEDLEEGVVTQDHTIKTVVSNIYALLTSAAEPVQELEKLHELSQLISHLKSQISRQEGSITKSEEHLRRHEIEIEVLKSELKDLEEQEKEGELNRAERIQKGQLEEKLSEYRQNASSAIQKKKKKKRQIAGHQKTIDQVISGLSGFLTQYDPESPQSLPLEAGRLGGQNFAKPTPSVEPKLLKVLQEKREGKYASFNVQEAKRQTIVKWRKRLRRWAPVAIVLAGLGGMGIYVAKLAADQESARATLTELLNYKGPETVKLMKRDIINHAVGENLNNRELNWVLNPKSVKEFDSILSSRHFIDVIGFSGDKVKIRLNPLAVKGFRMMDGEDVEIHLVQNEGRTFNVNAKGKERKDVLELELDIESYCNREKHLAVARVRRLLRVNSQVLAIQGTKPLCSTGQSGDLVEELHRKVELHKLKQEVLNHPFIQRLMGMDSIETFYFNPNGASFVFNIEAIKNNELLHAYLSLVLAELKEKKLGMDELDSYFSKNETLVISEDKSSEEPGYLLEPDPEAVEFIKSYFGKKAQVDVHYRGVNRISHVGKLKLSQKEFSGNESQFGISVTLSIGGVSHPYYSSLDSGIDRAGAPCDLAEVDPIIDQFVSDADCSQEAKANFRYQLMTQNCGEEADSTLFLLCDDDEAALRDKEAFMEMVKSEPITDELLSEYVKENPDEEAILIVLKIKAFRRLNLEAHTREGQRLLSSESTEEFHKNLRDIKSRRQRDPETESVADYKEKILNHPFVKKYMAELEVGKQGANFRDSILAAKTRDEINIIVDNATGMLNKGIVHGINEIIQAFPEQLYSNRDCDNGRVTVRFNSEVLKALKEVYGENAEIKLRLMKNGEEVYSDSTLKVSEEVLCDPESELGVSIAVFIGEVGPLNMQYYHKEDTESIFHNTCKLVNQCQNP